MDRDRRGAENFVLWIVCGALALVFLLSGAPKLIGGSTIGLQAAAMRGFPGWLRLLVGLVEVVGAIALLVPRTSAVAAALLAFVMIPAALTQWMSGEPGVFVPIVLFVLLLIVAWRRSADLVSDRYHRLRETPHPLLREGILAGLIGAGCIAVWFLGVDMVAGHPFFTPATLGRGLLRILGPVPVDQSVVTLVLVYTVFHVMAFMVVGVLAALLIDVAGREPSVLVGFVVLFAAFEVGFYALVGLMQQASSLGTLVWYQVMLGNLIAAVAMGAYLWRAHPGLHDQFVHALDAGD
jgi:uncharacterized membrane protein YphA (DoxX/SURF4 family)